MFLSFFVKVLNESNNFVARFAPVRLQDPLNCRDERERGYSSAVVLIKRVVKHRLHRYVRTQERVSERECV